MGHWVGRGSGTVPACEGLNDWCLLGFFSVFTAPTAGPEVTGGEQEQEMGWAS